MTPPPRDEPSSEELIADAKEFGDLMGADGVRLLAQRLEEALGRERKDLDALQRASVLDLGWLESVSRRLTGRGR